MLKRILDIVLVAILAVPATFAVSAVALVALFRADSPVFYVAKRAGRHGSSIRVLKLRTMSVSKDVDARPFGGSDVDLVTPMGRWMRRSRIDEIPQFWNVLRGDMSFVGPRPPLRKYLELYPDTYATVLSERPGMTGLATVVLCAREERLLSQCEDPVETEKVYRRRCIPIKARVDRIYAERKSILLDAYIIYLTVARILPLPGKRARRLFDQRGFDPTAFPSSAEATLFAPNGPDIGTVKHSGMQVPVHAAE